MLEQTPTPSEHVSERQLDEWLGDALSDSERARIDQHLSHCAACRTRKQTIESANAQSHAQAPTFQRSKLAWLGAPLLAACAALAFLALRPSTRAPSDHTRSQGAPRMGYYVKRGQDVSRGERRGTLHPGDALRFVYSADREYHLAIFSADARGVAVYFPSGPSAERVSAGQEVGLDFSVELDATLGRERVTALFCPEPFDIATVQELLSSGGSLPEPLALCQSVSFDLNKQPKL
jgi:hypothetical protein